MTPQNPFKRSYLNSANSSGWWLSTATGYANSCFMSSTIPPRLSLHWTLELITVVHTGKPQIWIIVTPLINWWWLYVGRLHMQIRHGSTDIALWCNLILRSGSKSPFITGRQRQRHIALRIIDRTIKSYARIQTPLLASVKAYLAAFKLSGKSTGLKARLVHTFELNFVCFTRCVSQGLKTIWCVISFRSRKRLHGSARVNL